EHQVAERLRHLLAVVGHHAGVGIGAGELTAGPSHLHLPGTHLVVREDEVAAAALHVEAEAEVLLGDGGTLHVPAGSAGPDRAGPAGLAGTPAAPVHAVEGVLLPRTVGVPAAFAEEATHGQLVEAGDAPEPLVGAHPEVEVGVDLVDVAGV